MIDKLSLLAMTTTLNNINIIINPIEYANLINNQKLFQPYI